jgi:hypothetical protein
MLCCTSTRAFAHHEAIFGPQSALVLSSDAYVSGQVFTRQTGSKSDRQKETTTVLSAGLTPSKRHPFSLAIIFPFSTLSSDPNSRTGLENVIVGARYRVDLPAVTNGIGGRESFFMTVGGVEMPTGTLDHSFGKGAFAGIAAGLMSVEKGPFSAIGYAFYRHPGSYKRTREGGNVFLGGGLAWTPIDGQRLFSLQLGMSHETHLRERVGSTMVENSGGSGGFAHPTMLYGFSQRVLLFAQTTLPVRQDWRNPNDKERFRVGTGLIVALGH